MKIAIAQAYNGVHKVFAKHLRNIGYQVDYFDIDRAGWPERAREASGDVYLWNADDKYEDRHLILDRVYFLQTYLGKPVFPDLNMYYCFNDKIKQNQILKFLDVPQLPTYVTFDQTEALRNLSCFGFPVILKDAHSCEGKGVFKLESVAELRSMVEEIFSETGFYRPHLHCRIKGYLYLQKYVSDLGQDLRVITIGGRVAAAYWRLAPEGEWKTNISNGGQACFENIPESALDICLDISEKLGYHWMSYDLIVKKDRVYVCEFSPVFGVKGARQAGLDIRKEQMDHLDLFLKD